MPRLIDVDDAVKRLREAEKDMKVVSPLRCKAIDVAVVPQFLESLPTIDAVPVVRWIPVTEQMPKNGEMVLCNTTWFVEVLQWDERADVWCGQHRGYPKSYVTHWMPLPEPPVRKGENG